MTEPEPMEEDTKIDYTEDFKSLVLEASLSNSLKETAERFKVPPEMLSEWQRQEGIDCVLDPSLSVTLTPAASTSAIMTPSTSSSIPVPTFKAESVKVNSEAGGELAQTTPVNRVYTKEVINQVLNYLEDHTVTEAAKLFQIPHSTVFGWARRQKAPPETQDSPELTEIKRTVLEYAETHTPAEVKAKFDIPTSTLYRWRRDKKALMLTLDENDNEDKKLPPRSIIRTNNFKASPSGTVKTEDWSTRDKIVQFAKRSKNYQVTARKFGVSPDDIKKWAKALRDKKKMKTVKANEPPKKRPRGRPRKVPLPPVESESEKDMDEDEEEEERFGATLYEGDNLDKDDDVTLDEDEIGEAADDDDDEEEEVEDEEEESDDEPEYDVRGNYSSSGGKRVKEFPQRLKAEAVRYGLKHGWTAAALKYKTSSTSVSRWATYEDPKSPWKLRVILEARQIGVKEAAKKFKVAQTTLEDWIDTSGKYCEELLEVKKEIDFNDTDENDRDQNAMIESDEDDEDRERCDVCEMKLSRDETMLEHLASKHLDKDGNCDVCGVGVEDFERHFRLHMVRVEEPGPGETEMMERVEVKVPSDDISDQDVQDLLKDLLVDV